MRTLARMAAVTLAALPLLADGSVAQEAKKDVSDCQATNSCLTTKTVPQPYSIGDDLAHPFLPPGTGGGGLVTHEANPLLKQGPLDAQQFNFERRTLQMPMMK